MSQSHFFANTVLATINLMRLAAKEGMPAGGHSDELFSLAFGIAGQEIHPIGTSTTNYLYDGRYLVEEIDQTANVVSRYTDGPKIDEPLSEFRVGTISYYEQDGIGSVSSLTNSTGTTAATYGYDTFGNLSASTGSLANSLRYAGREFDSESGLYYYRARFYDPLNGRFLSEDPIRSS